MLIPVKSRQGTVYHAFLCALCLLSVVSGTEISSFYGDFHQGDLKCDRVKISENVGCICVTGLWRFYSDCLSYYSLAGDKHCFKQFPKVLSTKSRKLKTVAFATEVLPTPESIALVRKDGNVVRVGSGKYLKTFPELDLKTFKFDLEDLVVTGSGYMIQGPLASICFSPQQNAYCTYRLPLALIGGQIQNISFGCYDDTPFVSPIYCDFIKEPQTCDEAASSLAMDAEAEDLSQSEKVSENAVRPHVQSLRREKRRLHLKGGRSALSHHPHGHGHSHTKNPLKLGRTFLGGPAEFWDVVKEQELNSEDEDYISPENLKNMTNLSPEAILSEIWNFVETEAEIVMGLKQRLDREIDYDQPYFKLLHMAKKVMQKVCPPSYVSPGFFDIATQAFIQVQVKRLIYDPPNANFPGYSRIAKALDACLKNLTVYPFLTKENQNASSACSTNGTGDGQFIMYNDSMEVNVSSHFVGLNKDPVVETVWKIFFTAQSFCFPFFKKQSFNDHHRFTAWLTPLFQNDISEIWLNSSATSMTYGQFLGNLEEVMKRVAYCAASSRLSPIKLAYPWQLPRPLKGGDVPAPPPSGGGGAANPVPPPPAGNAPAGTRRRRSITTPLASCLNKNSASQCISTARHFNS